MEREKIIYRLARLTPTSPRRWGKMTPHQMLCHLSDSYDVAMGEKHVSSATGPFQRSILKYLALHVPFRWPRGVATRPELDQASGAGTVPVEFMADRERLIRSIERFTRRDRDFAFSPHPIFGPLTEREWMRWAYLHLDHHLRQFGC